jgi:hypothetical protein
MKIYRCECGNQTCHGVSICSECADKSNKANSRLLAVAPELLDALQQCRDDLIDSRLSYDEAMVIKLTNLIKKARGEL